ncbi:MAG: exopolysaccharide biosynthesis polyprenyl glycosylphosphotransferase [Flavobacterium psychrophilum]
MPNRNKIHFEISERKVLLRIFDIITVLLALYSVGFVFNFNYFQFSTSNFYWTIVLGIYLTIFGTVFEMYNLQVASNQVQIIKSIVLTSSTTVLVYLLTPIFTPVLPSNRLQILFFYLAIFLALFVWRLIYVAFFASNRFTKNVILICDKDQLKELVLGLENADPHYKVVGYINSDNSGVSDDRFTGNLTQIDSNELEKFVLKNAVSEVVVASQNTEGITAQLYNQLIHLLENGFMIKEYTQVYETLTQRIPVQYVARDFYRYFPFSRSNQNHLYLLFIRLADLLVGFIGIAVGLGLLPFILIGNLLANRGSLFYTQERVGKNGVVFNIVKLRTMIKNAEANGAVFTTFNDSRVTAFGKIMRKTRIDEFPQFYNIIKGEMSLIGPRPERPVFVDEIAETMPFYETRHIIKPGLTGWAQVNYSYGESVNDSLIKLQYDLYYIKHRSIFLDINICVKTLSTILFYRGQ